MTLQEVFKGLNARIENLELGIDYRFKEAETAMAELKRCVDRRIDAVDGRMDEFIKRHGGSRVTEMRADDAPGSHR